MRKRRGYKGKRSYGKKRRKSRRIPRYGVSRGGIRL